MSGQKIAGILVLVAGLLVIATPILMTEIGDLWWYPEVKTLLYTIGSVLAVTGFIILMVAKKKG